MIVNQSQQYIAVLKNDIAIYAAERSQRYIVTLYSIRKAVRRRIPLCKYIRH